MEGGGRIMNFKKALSTVALALVFAFVLQLVPWYAAGMPTEASAAEAAGASEIHARARAGYDRTLVADAVAELADARTETSRRLRMSDGSFCYWVLVYLEVDSYSV